MNAALGIIIGLIVGVAIMFIISYFVGGSLPWVKASSLSTEKIGEILFKASQNTSNDANANAVMNVCAQWVRTFTILSNNEYVYKITENNQEKKYDFTDFKPKDNKSTLNPLVQFTYGDPSTNVAPALNWVKDSEGTLSYKVQINTPAVDKTSSKVNNLPGYTLNNDSGYIEMFRTRR